MGHIHGGKDPYNALRVRMDRHVLPSPDSPEIMRILRILYSPEDAELVRKIPLIPATIEQLSKKLALPADELEGRLTELAKRGLIFDYERKGRRYYGLPPMLGGVYEYVMMRARQGLPMEELSRLFADYMSGNADFMRAALRGETQFARALVREEALPDGQPHSEVLDWECVTRLIETASDVSIALCPCRHTKSHLGTACDRPQRTCISLNAGARNMIHDEISQRIAPRDALRIVEECKAEGLVQIGDNVQRGQTFLCNCCRCCCTLFRGARTFNIEHPVVTSNWIAEVDETKCAGCGRCAETCPTDAVYLDAGQARVAYKSDLCLGCGVCATRCRSGAIRMRPRARRVFTPETSFDMIGHMAIERGKVAELLFDEPESVPLRMVQRFVRLLEKSAPWKAAMAVRPLRSAFLNAALKLSGETKE